MNGKGLWAGNDWQKFLFKFPKKLTDESSSQHRAMAVFISEICLWYPLRCLLKFGYCLDCLADNNLRLHFETVKSTCSQQGHSLSYFHFLFLKQHLCNGILNFNRGRKSCFINNLFCVERLPAVSVVLITRNADTPN